MRIRSNQDLTDFEQLFNDFIVTCKAKGLSEKTISTYQRHLHCISKYLDITKPMVKIKQSDLESIVVELRSRDISPNTIQSYVRTIITFLNWCKRCGYSNLSLAPYKGEESVKDTYTDAELRVLL